MTRSRSLELRLESRQWRTAEDLVRSRVIATSSARDAVSVCKSNNVYRLLCITQESVHFVVHFRASHLSGMLPVCKSNHVYRLLCITQESVHSTNGVERADNIC